MRSWGEGRARNPLAPGSEARLPTVWLNWRHVNSYPPFLFVTDARHSVCIDGCRRCAKDDIRMTRPTHEQRRHSDRRLCVLWPGKSQMHQLLPGIKRRNALGSQTSICTWTLASELGCKYMLGNRRGSDPDDGERKSERIVRKSCFVGSRISSLAAHTDATK